MSQNHPCPEFEELERLLAGALAGESRREMGVHVENCPTCAGRLADVSENLEALEGIALVLREQESAAGAVPPQKIGSFTIIRELARGGMGVVYLAEQKHPRRQVALKVLRPGLGSGEAMRRFEMEAEFLARLRHPGIATVYEAGMTTVTSGVAAERVPYIAMEYVRGERLDRHVESRRLTTAQCLDLLARIADAVHHAHVNGLVHRDLKPGNILVVPSDDESSGEPKVLDFGVARLTGVEGDATQRTSTGQLLGTLPYMSPEQLAGNPEAVDERADIYALGVVAFEMLTGELPHDVKSLSIIEAARVIRDETPLAPGRRNPALRGDIDTLLRKMLEKDPGRRYASAAEAAEDIRRFLGREPIRARPPNSLYQLSRFAQRNRALAASLTGLLLVLLAAVAVSGGLAVRATRAERRAQLQLEETRRQAAKFEAVNTFMEEMVAAASPEDHPGRSEVTVRESLGQGSVRLDEGSLAGQPDIELGVRTAIGNTYRALGEYEDARRQLEQAVDLGRRLHPDGHEDLANALNKLGRTLQEFEELDAAEALYRECLDMRRALSGTKPEDIAISLNNLADLLSRKGRNQEALALHREALAIRRRVLGPAHEDIASSLNNIAVVNYALGDLADAEWMFRESLQMDQNLRGDVHPNVATTMNNLAMVVSRLGRLEEAEPLHRRALELEREIYGPEHPKLAISLQNLARLLVTTDKLEEAELLFGEALSVQRRAFGEKHPGVANILGNFASLYEKRGDFDQAVSLHEEALVIRREALGDGAVATLGSRYNLARVTAAQGRLDDAAGAYASLARDARQALPSVSRHLFTILSGYGLCLSELQRHQEAADVLQEAYEIGSAAVGENDSLLAEVAEALAGLQKE